MTWLMENLGTILITLAMVGFITLIILSMAKSKKKGQHMSCNCSNCSNCTMCRYRNDSGSLAPPNTRKV